MKSTIRKITLNIGLATGVLLGMSGCQKMFDLAPEEALSTKQMYRDIYDADAAIIGLYGKFSTLAKQYVILNELRGDLLDVTTNADLSLREINAHTVSETNEYANPRAYYEVILNCNDILKNFKIMLDQNKIKRAEYYQRSADVLALRSWIYLQLGIHYGSVPYVTESVETVNDVKALATKARVPLADIVKELIKELEAIPA
jgi:hypothetical protein